MQRQLEILARAVKQWQRTDRPVSQSPSAEQLKNLIDVSLAGQGADARELSKAIDDYLMYSPNVTRPEFFKLLYSGLNAEALLGDWIASLSNSTMHTYQVAPVATLIELELIAQCNRLLGFDDGEGVMVAGGSQANLIGMMLARHRVQPNIKSQGLIASGSKVLRAYVSDQAHYSYQRAVNLLGLGSENLVTVASNDDGQLIPSELQRHIIADKAAGLQPFFIGLTAGTTVVGAFDEVLPCKEIADKHELWLHIDGAWGAPVLFSKKHRHLLANSELADSLAWDAHKLMNVPITAAFILVKEQGQLQAATAGGGGDYLFHADANADYNLGERSIQCGRRADALKVWLSWKSKGHSGFAAKVDALQELKLESLKLIDDKSCLQTIGPSGFLNVLFRYSPNTQISEAQSAVLNQNICKEMVQRGGPYVDYAQYKGRTGIRVIFGNDAAQPKHLALLFDQVQAIGEELSA